MAQRSECSGYFKPRQSPHTHIYSLAYAHPHPDSPTHIQLHPDSWHCCSYLGKRTAIELDMHKKLSQLSRTVGGGGDALEFCEIWTPMLEEHCRWSQWYRDNFLESVAANFIQPLVALRLKQEKERKSLKETWAKETKRVGLFLLSKCYYL